MQADDLLDARAAAELLGMTVNTLTFWRWAGKGPRYRIVGTRAVRYLRSDVLAFRDGVQPDDAESAERQAREQTRRAEQAARRRPQAHAA